MADDKPTTATSAYLNQPLRTEAEARAMRPSSDLADIAIGIHNAMQDLGQLEDTLIILASGEHGEHFQGLFYLLADAMGSYLRELRQAHDRLEAAAGAS